MIAITGWAASHRRERTAPPAAPPPVHAAALTALPRPLAFEANRGQWDGEALFRAAGRGGTAFVTRTGAVFALPGDAPGDAARRPGHVPARGDGPAIAQEPVGSAPRRDAAAFRMRVVGATDAARAEGLEELPGKANFFLGNDPARWRTGVPTYAKAKVTGVLPGVDVAYYGREGQLEYDFVVAPGVDAGAVRIAFEGVESLAVNADGDLAVRVAGRDVLQRRPQVYEDGPAGRRPLGAAYVLLPGNEVAFRVDGRDPARRVVIDPVIVYGKLLGGTSNEQNAVVAVDGSGGVFVGGTTYSTDFPVSSSGGGAPGGSSDGFVVKLNASGPVFSTYLGGSNADYVAAIAVDGAGTLYVTGATYSTDLPTKTPYQAALGGVSDGFVTKLSGSDGSLVYSTYLGGSAADSPAALAVDAASSAYVVGVTQSTDFPLVNPVVQTRPGYLAAFATKLSATGKMLVYSTYLGGSQGPFQPVTDARGIAVDAAGSAYVVGDTSSTDFPTTPGAFQPAPGAGTDAFVVKLKSGGSLAYSTFLGGALGDAANAIAVDAAGNAHVVGSTSSTDFPTAHALQPTIDGTDAFVIKLAPDGSRPVFSTYLGGTGADYATAVQVDGAGHVYVAGKTLSKNLPVAAAPQPEFGGGASDAFVAKLTADGARVIYATYLGGTRDDDARGMAIDAAGAVYVSGLTNSANFPVTPAQEPAAGSTDAFVVTLTGPTLLSLSPGLGALEGGAVVTLSGDQFASGATVTFGGVPATAVTWVNADTITAVAPAHAAGAVDVVVTNPGGTAAKLAGAFTYAPAPKIGAASPAQGPTAGGTTVTVTGSAFIAGATISFGGTPATGVSVASATSLTAVAPQHAAGAVDVVVTNPGGLSGALAGGFVYVPPPSVSGVAPASGPIAGGTVATVSGASFQVGAAVSVGGAAATNVTVASATSLTLTVPAHAAGVADVVVTNPDGQSATLAGAFTYLTPPSLASISPTSGPIAGGTRVTVTGERFQPGATVAFDGAPATSVSVASATSLTAVAPPHAAGAVDVAVTNPDGQAGSLAGGFLFVGPPAVTAVEPPTGTTAGGTLVTLSGTGFQPGATVSFGGAASGLVSVASATRLTASSPQHAPGQVDLVVTNPDGQRTTVSSGFTYVAGTAPAPTLVTVAPASGPEAGGTRVTLTGTGFQAGMVVSLGGAAATDVRVDTGTSVTATTPAHAAGLVDVSVSNPDGQSATLARTFAYFVEGAPAPTIAGVSPSAGVEGGGWKATVTGTGFMAGAAVAFGGQPGLDVAVVSTTDLTATVPAHGKGAVDVVVTNPDGQAATLAAGVSYVGKPSSGCGCASSGAGLDVFLGLAAAAAARLRRRSAPRRGGAKPAEPA